MGYNVYYHNPDGTVQPIYSALDSYTVDSLPSDYPSSVVPSLFQLFMDASYSASVTSQYYGSNFTIYRAYSSWAVGSVSGNRVSPGARITISSYTSNGELHLYPVVSHKYAVGYFGPGPYDYKTVTLTGKCNYSGGTDTTLSYSVRRLIQAGAWTQFCGMPLSGGIPPGTTQTIQLTGINYTEGNTINVIGTYSGVTTNWETYESKSLANLTKPTRGTSTSSYNVYLKTSDDISHADETLKVSQTTSYTFQHWSTTSDGQAVSESAAPTSNTTYYAIWKSSKSTSTKLPSWTTTATMKYGESAYAEYTLSCYSTKTDTVPFYTHTAYKYEFKPAKHVRWKSGSSTYTIGSTVTLSSGSTYYAVWEPDSSGTSTYELSNNKVSCPTPTSRGGFTYLGLATSNTATTPTYQPGSQITIDNNMNLYGIWKANGTVEIYNSTTKKFEKYQAVIYNSTTKKWDLYIPKIYNGSDWNDIYI